MKVLYVLTVILFPLIALALQVYLQEGATGQSTQACGLASIGADITIISEEDWPTDWPVMEAANPQIHGIGGDPCEIPGYDRGGGY